jgi:hypothetical protein
MACVKPVHFVVLNLLSEWKIMVRLSHTLKSSSSKWANIEFSDAPMQGTYIGFAAA